MCLSLEHLLMTAVGLAVRAIRVLAVLVLGGEARAAPLWVEVLRQGVHGLSAEEAEVQSAVACDAIEIGALDIRRIALGAVFDHHDEFIHEFSLAWAVGVVKEPATAGRVEVAVAINALLAEPADHCSAFADDLVASAILLDCRATARVGTDDAIANGAQILRGLELLDESCCLRVQRRRRGLQDCLPVQFCAGFCFDDAACCDSRGAAAGLSAVVLAMVRVFAVDAERKGALGTQCKIVVDGNTWRLARDARASGHISHVLQRLLNEQSLVSLKEVVVEQLLHCVWVNLGFARWVGTHRTFHDSVFDHCFCKAAQTDLAEQMPTEQEGVWEMRAWFLGKANPAQVVAASENRRRRIFIKRDQTHEQIAVVFTVKGREKRRALNVAELDVFVDR
eukprot:comp21850_c0_seq1/m.49401 comp21850_c0_seq1/g.49401  ORF comp21850_c0_seq1/g.49401 comp21850_c0_seq1/m.49401 type:complete len:394 (-) comp21850_c0_seq1:167-1348(-)